MLVTCLLLAGLVVPPLAATSPAHAADVVSSGKVFLVRHLATGGLALDSPPSRPPFAGKARGVQAGILGGRIDLTLPSTASAPEIREYRVRRQAPSGKIVR